MVCALPCLQGKSATLHPLFGQGPALFFPAGPTGNGARSGSGWTGEGQPYGSGVVAHTWSCTASL